MFFALACESLDTRQFTVTQSLELGSEEADSGEKDRPRLKAVELGGFHAWFLQLNNGAQENGTGDCVRVSSRRTSD